MTIRWVYTPEELRYSRESAQWRGLAKALHEANHMARVAGFRPMFDRLMGHVIAAGKDWKRQIGTDRGTHVLLFLFLACEAEDGEGEVIVP
jgi:hypothetical protein